MIDTALIERVATARKQFERAADFARETQRAKESAWEFLAHAERQLREAVEDEIQEAR